MSTNSDVTTLQEYVISAIVIALFGLLYFYLSGSFSSNKDSSLAVAGSAEGLVFTSLGSNDANKLSLHNDIKTPSVKVEEASSQVEKPEVVAETTIDSSQSKKISEEDMNLNEMKSQVDESAQKIDEVKHQLAVGALEMPAATMAVKEEKPLGAGAEKEEKPEGEITFDDLIFKLPNGRKIEIPAKGFENKLRKAIVKGDRNTPIIFDRVYFDTGSKNLSSQSDYQISSTAALLNTYKDINVVIRGHSDNKGSPKKNAQLSLFRSGSMKKALVDLGIDSRRIHIEGLGEMEPIDSNKTKRGRRNNRRIDLVIKN